MTEEATPEPKPPGGELVIAEEPDGRAGLPWRMDSTMVNMLSGLGGRKDRTTANAVGVARILTHVELGLLYRSNGYAARAVDLIPNECTRKGFLIKLKEASKSEDDANPFAEDLKRLRFFKKLKRAGKWAKLYGGAAIILGLNDGGDFEEPLNIENLKEVRWAHVVDRHSLSYESLETDPTSADGFGLPDVYTLNFRDAKQVVEVGTDGEELHTGDKIHASRMIRFWGIELPDDLAAEEDYWGDSLLQRLFESLANLHMADRALGNIVHSFNQSILRLKGLRKLIKAKDGKKDFEELIEAHLLSESILGMMVLDMDGEEFEKRATPVTGIEDVYDRITQAFSAQTGYPMTVFFGTTPGGMSTDNEQGTRNFENLITDEQAEVYIPPVERICELLSASSEGPDLDIDDYIVEAVPLREQSEKEEAETLKTLSEAVAVLIDRAVLRASEVRNSWFRSAEFNSAIQLEEIEDVEEFNEEKEEAAAKERAKAFGLPVGPGGQPIPPGQPGGPPMPNPDDPDDDPPPPRGPTEDEAELAKALRVDLDIDGWHQLDQLAALTGETRSETLIHYVSDVMKAAREKNMNLDELDDEFIDELGTDPKLDKDLVGYELSDAMATMGRSCERCSWFDGEGSCQIVSGEIHPDAHCDMWGSRTDANTDPAHVRSARRRIQTLVQNGTLKPAKDCKCADCGKRASEYDHVAGYDAKGSAEKVKPLCASCHHKRTNARLKKSKKS